MRRHLLRRALLAPPILLGVLTLTFLLVHAAPGSPFTLQQASSIDPRAAARLREIFGADDPLAVSYLHWLKAFLTGDLGVSFTYRRPVSEVLGAALPATLLLAFSSLVVSIVAGTAAAVASALSSGRLLDRAIAWMAAAFYAAPPFWVGILLVMALSAGTGWLPASGMHDVDAARWGVAARLTDLLRHLALPCLTLAAPGAAAMALMLRAALAEAMDSPCLLAARARGASHAALVARHGLCNAAAPAITLIGLGLPALVGGSLVVEVLFAWPGMGRVTYEAILARDAPVVVGASALSAAVTLASTLVADVLYVVADPRVRPGSRETGRAAAGGASGGSSTDVLP